MHCLSLKQPWASLVVLGAKRIETRTWACAYKGPLAIHASKSLSKEVKELCAAEPLRSILRLCDVAEVGELPVGCIVGAVQLVDCFQFGSLREKEYEHLFDGLEPAMGNHAPGRWGWVLDEPVIADGGLKASGSLGLWSWPEPQLGSWTRRPWIVNCATPGCESRAAVGTRARCWPEGRCPVCVAQNAPVLALEYQTGGPYPLSLPPARVRVHAPREAS